MIWLTSWFHQEIQCIPLYLLIYPKCPSVWSQKSGTMLCIVAVGPGLQCICPVNRSWYHTGRHKPGQPRNCGALHDIGRKFFISRIMKKDWVPVSSSYNNVSHLKLTLLFRIKRGARRYFVKETIDTSIWYEMNDLHIFAIYDKKIYVFQIRWKLLVILVKNRDESINIAVQCQNCMILNQTKSFIRARIV